MQCEHCNEHCIEVSKLIVIAVKWLFLNLLIKCSALNVNVKFLIWLFLFCINFSSLIYSTRLFAILLRFVCSLFYLLQLVEKFHIIESIRRSLSTGQIDDVIIATYRVENSQWKIILGHENGTYTERSLMYGWCHGMLAFHGHSP